MSELSELRAEVEAIKARNALVDSASKKIADLQVINTATQTASIAIQSGSVSNHISKQNLQKELKAAIRQNTNSIQGLSSITSLNTKLYTSRELFSLITKDVPSDVTLDDGNNTIEYAKIQCLNGYSIFKWVASAWVYNKFIPNPVSITPEQSSNIDYSILSLINAIQKNKTLNLDSSKNGSIKIVGNNLDTISQIRLLNSSGDIVDMATITINNTFININFINVTEPVGSYKIQYKLSASVGLGLGIPDTGTWRDLKTIYNKQLSIELTTVATVFKNIYEISDNVIRMSYITDDFNSGTSSVFDQSWEDLIRADNLYVLEIKDNLTNPYFDLESGVQFTNFNLVNVPSSFEFNNGTSYLFKKISSDEHLGTGPIYQIQEIKESTGGGVAPSPSFAYPSWFNGLQPQITDDENGISTAYSISSLVWVTQLLTETPYYVATNGNDSNDGLSLANAKLTVSNALSAGAKLIYMSEGNYHKSTFGVNYNVNGDDIAIIGVGKVRICGYHKGQTWAETSVGSNAYRTVQSIASTAEGVIDFLNLDADGDGSLLTQVLTEADCIATPGTWYKDGGGADIFTVHMIDDRAVNNGVNMSANLSGGAGFKSDSGRLLMENIEIAFSLSFLSNTSASTFEVYLKDYSIPYPRKYKVTDTGSENGLSINGISMVLENCSGKNSSSDVFNYHNTLGIAKMDVTEIDCNIKNPNFEGKNTNGIYQCSTVHEGVNMLRVNGTYENGDKDAIKDVGTSSSVLIGCAISNDGSVRSGQDIGSLSVIDGYCYKVVFQGSGDIEGSSNLDLVSCTIDPLAVMVGNVNIIT